MRFLKAFWKIIKDFFIPSKEDWKQFDDRHKNDKDYG